VSERAHINTLGAGENIFSCSITSSRLQLSTFTGANYKTDFEKLADW
jgi:hypothetical protein